MMMPLCHFRHQRPFKYSQKLQRQIFQLPSVPFGGLRSQFLQYIRKVGNKKEHVRKIASLSSAERLSIVSLKRKPLHMFVLAVKNIISHLVLKKILSNKCLAAFILNSFLV